MREHSKAPGSSAPTFGGINRLLYLSGPQHLPVACPFPVTSLDPFFLLWDSAEPISSPCFCRAWLFYLCGVGGRVGLIKAVVFLHVLAVLSVDCGHPTLRLPASQEGLAQPGRHQPGQGAGGWLSPCWLTAAPSPSCLGLQLPGPARAVLPKNGRCQVPAVAPGHSTAPRAVNETPHGSRACLLVLIWGRRQRQVGAGLCLLPCLPWGHLAQAWLTMGAPTSRDEAATGATAPGKVAAAWNKGLSSGCLHCPGRAAVLLRSWGCPGAASTMLQDSCRPGPACQCHVRCSAGAGAWRRADHSDSPLPPVLLLGKVTHRVSSQPCVRRGSARPAGPVLSW